MGDAHSRQGEQLQVPPGELTSNAAFLAGPGGYSPMLSNQQVVTPGASPAQSAMLQDEGNDAGQSGGGSKGGGDFECEPALLSQLVQILGGRNGTSSLLLSDLGALLPAHLRIGVKEKGGLRSWLQKYPELFQVTGMPGKESVTLLLGMMQPMPVAGTSKEAGGPLPAPVGPQQQMSAAELADAKRLEDAENESAIQLRGLPYRATVQDVKNFLGDFAKYLQDDATSIQLVLNRDGRPSGFGRVQFKSPEMAVAVKNTLHMKCMEVAGAHKDGQNEKGERYVEIFLYTERPNKLRFKKTATADGITDMEKKEKEEIIEDMNSTKYQVLEECKQQMSQQGKAQVLLSMLGVALSPVSRLYLKKSDQGLKHFLGQFPELFDVSGNKGRELITYLPRLGEISAEDLPDSLKSLKKERSTATLQTAATSQSAASQPAVTVTTASGPPQAQNPLTWSQLKSPSAGMQSPMVNNGWASPFDTPQIDNIDQTLIASWSALLAAPGSMATPGSLATPNLTSPNLTAPPLSSNFPNPALGSPLPTASPAGCGSLGKRRSSDAAGPASGSISDLKGTTSSSIPTSTERDIYDSVPQSPVPNAVSKVETPGVGTPGLGLPGTPSDWGTPQVFPTWETLQRRNAAASAPPAGGEPCQGGLPLTMEQEYELLGKKLMAQGMNPWNFNPGMLAAQGSNAQDPTITAWQNLQQPLTQPVPQLAQPAPQPANQNAAPADLAQILQSLLPSVAAGTPAPWQTPGSSEALAQQLKTLGDYFEKQSQMGREASVQQTPMQPMQPMQPMHPMPQPMPQPESTSVSKESEEVVYIRLRGLPYDANEQDILAWMAKHDAVEHIADTKQAVRIFQKNNGKPMGLAVIAMSSKASADHVLQALNGQYMGTRYIEVFPHVEGEAGTDKACVAGATGGTPGNSQIQALVQAKGKTGEVPTPKTPDGDTGGSDGSAAASFSVATPWPPTSFQMPTGGLPGLGMPMTMSNSMGTMPAGSALPTMGMSPMTVPGMTAPHLFGGLAAQAWGAPGAQKDGSWEALFQFLKQENLNVSNVMAQQQQSFPQQNPLAQLAPGMTRSMGSDGMPGLAGLQCLPQGMMPMAPTDPSRRVDSNL